MIPLFSKLRTLKIITTPNKNEIDRLESGTKNVREFLEGSVDSRNIKLKCYSKNNGESLSR